MRGDALRWLDRLDVVEQRLQVLATTERRGVTTADPATGERWQAGQVWAHLAEFVPYWLDQLEAVSCHGRGEPVAFGRTKSDPGRIAAIARDQHSDVETLHGRLTAHLGQLRDAIEEMDDDAWDARGRHETLGVMTMDAFMEEFLVGHLEQHAAQLESLAAVPVS